MNKIELMHTLGRLNKKLFAGHGRTEDELLGRGQANILSAIVKSEKVTQDELAGILNLDKTTVAKAVKKLEVTGLIIRTRSKEDSRKKEIVATEKARLLNKEMDEHLENHSNVVFEGVSDEELEVFQGVLEKIERNVEGDRKMINMQRHFSYKVMREIEELEGATLQEITHIFPKEEAEVKEVVDLLLNRGLLMEEDGVFHATERAMEFRNRRYARRPMAAGYRKPYGRGGRPMNDDDFGRPLGRGGRPGPGMGRNRSIDDGRLHRNMDRRR